MLKRHSLLFFLAAFCIQGTAEAGCAPVDLRDRLGEARDQGTTDWCYGFAMADLLSFHLGVRLSAFDLSLRTFLLHERAHYARLREENARQDSSILEYRRGRTPDAMDVARREGVCEERHVRSGSPEAPLDDWIDTIEALSRAGGPSSGGTQLTCSAADAAGTAYPTLSEPDLAEGLLSGSKLGIFQTLSERSCAGRRVPLPSGLHYELTTLKAAERAGRRGDRLLPALAGILDRGEPAAVQFDLSRFLASPRGELVHVALVVGRRDVAGACQYLVRNSWGRGCASYSRPCERGHIWLSEEDIRSSASYVGGLRQNQ